MKNFKYIWVLGLIGTTAIIVGAIWLLAIPNTPPADDPWTYVASRDIEPTDHSKIISGTFTTGQEVTQTCLTCHENAAHEVMDTVHWTWKSKPVEVSWRDEPVSIGKANTLNNFCIGIQSNWAGYQMPRRLWLGRCKF